MCLIFFFEGTLVTFKYTVDSTDVDQRFMTQGDADTSTLKVSVQILLVILQQVHIHQQQV